MSYSTSTVATPAADGYTVQPRSMNIPTNLRAPNVMSTTSLAAECFINQKFSGKMQAMIISYNSLIFTEHPIYAV
jgi:hypothetical protein